MASSQPHELYSTQAKVQRSNKMLSLGIELEGLVAYNEQVLRRFLPPRSEIAKEPCYPPGQRLDKNIYPGWAVFDISKPSTFMKPNEPICQIVKHVVDRSSDGSLGEADMELGFGDSDEENANIDQQVVLQTAVAGTNSTKEDGAKSEEQVVLDKWLVRRDFSVRQLTREQKSERGLDPDEWDTSDIEFVTKAPYLDIARLQADIHALNAALESDDLKVLLSNTCGLHVHVGFPNNSVFPLPAIKVLMFTLVVFEREISRLHAPQRIARYADRDSNISPNLAGWKHPDAEEGVGEAVEEEQKHDHDFKHARQRRSTHQSISNIREQIFPPRPLYEVEEFERLKSLFPRGKNHIINWRNIDGDIERRADPKPGQSIFHPPRRPPTIEFRQHEGTFDPVEIGHWVHFCRAIVQFGLDHAMDGRRVFLPTIQSWASRIRIEDLLGVLRLPEETREFYMAKAKVKVKELPEQDPLWEEAVATEAGVEWRILEDD